MQITFVQYLGRQKIQTLTALALPGQRDPQPLRHISWPSEVLLAQCCEMLGNPVFHILRLVTHTAL